MNKEYLCVTLITISGVFQGKKMSARNRITLMLIVVIIVFVLCITPDAIMSTVFGFGYVEGSYLVKVALMFIIRKHIVRKIVLSRLFNILRKWTT